MNTKVRKVGSSPFFFCHLSFHLRGFPRSFIIGPNLPCQQTHTPKPFPIPTWCQTGEEAQLQQKPSSWHFSYPEDDDDDDEDIQWELAVNFSPNGIKYVPDCPDKTRLISRWLFYTQDKKSKRKEANESNETNSNEKIQKRKKGGGERRRMVQGGNKTF